MMFGTRSIRQRLLLILGCVISVAMFLQIFLSYRMAIEEVDSISDYHMLQMGLAMRRSLLEPPKANDDQTPLLGPIDQDDNCFTLKVSPRPLLVKLSEPSPEGESSTANSQPKLPFHEFTMQTIQGKTYRVLSMVTHTKLISVSQDLTVRRHSARELALRTVLPSLFAGPLILLIIWWGISHALRPMVASRKEISQRNANDLHPLRTENVPEECLPFIKEINFLFTRISSAFAAQKSFVANAAHELRSPLTALRLQAQSLQRATTQQARDVASTRLIAGIDRATRLVEQMLMLAHEEANQAEKSCICLPAVMRLALGDVLPAAQEKQIDIGAEISESIPESRLQLSGNMEAMRILLRNLLENAVKYSPAQGVVNLYLQRENNELVLSVEDNGPGIPEAEREQVFKRFYRCAGNDVDGNGLGLAIVQAIAEQHQIQIRLGQSERLGGLQVALRMPAA